VNKIDELKLTSLAMAKAKELGADLTGIASVDKLKESPSHTLAPQISPVDVGQGKNSSNPGVVTWPEDGKSVIMIAVSHPKKKPELDWWHGKYMPPGNKIIRQVIKGLKEWIEANYSDVTAHHMPYQVEKGGIFLKDAAVLAGFGCIGQNNLLLTPEFGPQVRLGALIINKELVCTGPISFDPCTGCEGYCLKKCPQEAFDKVIYSKEKFHQDVLPAIDGSYDRYKCNEQMLDDENTAEKKEKVLYEEKGEMVRLVKYCRNCELICPLGNQPVN